MAGVLSGVPGVHGSLCVVVFVGAAVAYEARADCLHVAATVESLQGVVEARESVDALWQPVALEEALCSGALVRTLANSRASLRLSNHTLLRLDQNSAITFPDVRPDDASHLDLLSGVGHFISRVKRRFDVVTPFVNAAVDGTEFVVGVNAERSQVTVFEGQVTAQNRQGSVALVAGQTATAGEGEAPVLSVLVRPRDAVQWALYYPSVIDAAAFVEFDPPSAERYRRSVELFNDGDIGGAIDALPGVMDNAALLIYRASLYLTVGRVSQAEADLMRALAIDPQRGDVMALQAVIAVVNNRQADALALAERAIEFAPGNAASYLALSYAHQASFDIERARRAVAQAVEVVPDSALAWARLAELHLSSGELGQALAAADRAVALNPRLARTQSVLGFAYLSRVDIHNARDAFERAIVLDSTDPQARLGLGLAKVRRGDLPEGRAEIELAASLDPNNAVVRSYLGKAYYEEKRNAVAAPQLSMAKVLDPLDPTPWFYDAIRKQTENRPVEAVQDLQHSIALNDNRIVYRSRLLVDGDEAARNATLARTYKDLGFERLALSEGWTSVNTDPSNHSAHRFLADSYSALSRHESARVSELLQAQLLQPLTPSPVQPQLAESDLLILQGAGPNAATFNEFNSLFTRDDIVFQLTGVAGNNETWGDELVFSGVEGKFAYSVGQFHYETDGFRDNNDLRHDIYNVFGQVALTPQLNVQAEYRERETESGDLSLRFGSEVFDANLRQEIRRQMGRLGLHYRPSLSNHLLVSAVYHKDNEKFITGNVEDFSELILPPPLNVIDLSGISRAEELSLGLDSEEFSTEIQYISLINKLDLMTGAGYYNADETDKDVEAVTLSVPDGFILPPGFPVPPDLDLPPNETISEMEVEEKKAEYFNVYTYANVSLGEEFIFTLGVSFDSLDNAAVELDEVSRKVGMMWRPSSSTLLRAAWFEVVNKPYNQTLEPTNVAGFNQLFDETVGSISERFGVALRQRFTPDLTGGLEISQRDVDQPRSGLVSTFNKVDEYTRRLFVSWAATSRIALSAEYVIEQFDQSFNSPARLETHLLPLFISYSQPFGFFSTLTFNHVDQKIETAAGGLRSGDDAFWLVDASIGYVLPRRYGRVQLNVKNVFDETFNYQGDNFFTSEPQTAEFLPVRMILGQFELLF